MYVNLRSYISYISGNDDKTLLVRLLRRFGGFSVLCKGFSSGALLISDRRTKGHDTHPQPHSSTSEATSSITPREGSVDGWGKYGLRSSLLAFKTMWRKKGQNQSAQGNALGIVRNQHSPRMGKRIIIPFTPFATLQWWAVILLPPSGAYPCCILSPRALPGAGISMPLRGVTNTHPQPKGGGLTPTPNPSPREGR